MKRSYSFFALSILVSILLFFNCSKEKNNPSNNTSVPVITFTNNISSATITSPTTSYTITGTISSLVGLKSVVFYRFTSTGSIPLMDITSFSDNKNYLFTFIDSAITVSQLIEVTATDNNGSSSQDFVITVINTTSSYNPINTWINQTLGCAANTSIGNYYASISGTVYNIFSAQINIATIDIVYEYIAGQPPYFASPSVIASLTGGRITNFSTTSLTPNIFTNMRNDSLISSLTPNQTQIIISSGNVYAFKNAAGKIGVIYVSSPPTSGSQGSVTFFVKVQQ